MRIFILSVFFIFPTVCLCKITANVVQFKGDVLYNGKQITKKTIFEENGRIEVKASSYLKIKVKEYNSTITLGPDSSFLLHYNKNEKISPYYFLKGLMRWKTEGKSKYKGYFRTKLVSIGVRGTDFLVTINSLLKETEIYCFTGEIIFQNRKDKADRAVVKKNDWAGVGGRFSPNVGEVVPMTQKQIDHVKTLLN